MTTRGQTGELRMPGEAALRWDAAERVVDVALDVQFLVNEQVDAHCRRVADFARRQRREGEPVYLLNDDGYRCEPDLVAYVAEKVRTTDPHHVVIRYGGDTASRSTLRLVNMKAHTPSNFATRTEALEAVRRHRAAR